MIKQATVEDIKANRVTKRHGYIAVVTHYYPRYLKKKLIDEFNPSLAPSRDLLKEFKEKEHEIDDHNRAFDLIEYEEKFSLTTFGIDELRRISEVSHERDVYLVCFCQVGQRCHREILMILASVLYGARISRLHFTWDKFRARIPVGFLQDRETRV